MAIEKRQFLFGMDQDSDDRFIQPGFTRKNLNVRVGSSVSDGNGTGENISGNVLIPNLGLPEGNNRVVGSYWYKKKDLSYFFVWNENEDHGIYEYNHVSSHISTVMIAKVLGFTELGLITGINVVEFDDDNDLLYWTALSINPSKINIQKAKAGSYTLPIKKEIIDAIKYPPLCPIVGVYELDKSQKINYLENKILQFKARYIYDDKEKSAFSPISINIFPTLNCSGQGLGNTIRITVPKGGELVRRVEIAGRFSNTSDFFKIIDQSIDIYDVNALTGDYEYVFRNDANYNIVNLAESDSLFDRVPQIAGAQEFIAGNRIAYGDITENYDNVPIEVELDVNFKEIEERKSNNTIEGKIRIRNIVAEGLSSVDKYLDFQPIHNPKTAIVYGGYDKNYELKQDKLVAAKQSIPLGGFVVYLAGTDLYSVSEQITQDNGNEKFQTNGVYDTDTSSARGALREDIEGSERGGSRVFSRFKIENIPDGTYVLRVASNLTTQSQLDSGTRDYQKTSVPIYDNGGVGVFEQVIKVSGGEIKQSSYIVIADLTEMDSFRSSTQLSGYVVDPIDKGAIPNDYSISDVLLSPRINKAKVYFSVTNNGLLSSTRTFTRNTDHNGFFYAGSSTNITTQGFAEIKVYKIQSGDYIDDNTLQYSYLSTITPPPSASSITVTGSGGIIVISNQNSNITDYNRTRVIFKITNNSGSNVKGIYAVITNNQTQEPSDTNGNLDIIVYGNTGSSSSLLSEDIYFYPTDVACVSDFDPVKLSFSEIIGEDDFNYNTPIELNDVISTAVNSFNPSSLKRGGSYTTGIVYYDRANRSGLVNVSHESELLIPFYTEELDGAIPFDSPPSISWQIKHLPPSWATHYQWVRTKNTSTSRYLQWSPKAVSYLSSSGASSNFTEGTQISMDITNLSTEYISTHPDSVLSYDYTPGDRIRFIKDSNHKLFDDYYDVKITSFAAGILTMEKLNTFPDFQKGCLFEIYTPKLELEKDIYYEIGECFKVIKIEANIVNTITTFYIHEGLTQNQDPLSNTPAKGTFRSGDTFYRNRTIPLSNADTDDKRNRIDSSRLSDFYESSVSDIGRPNLEDQDASVVHRPTTIYYSQRFIPETNINGLNTFYSPSFETYDRKNGAIRKLFSINNRLDCYQELKVSKILVQENVVFDQFDKGTVGVSESVLSNPSVPYQGEYGTMNPESFSEEGGRRYFFDVRNGAVLRLSNDGLTVISDKQMHAYFESKSNFYSSFDQVPEIWGVFDENHDEYVLNFGSISREEGFSPEDLALVSSQAEVVTETKNGLEYTFIIGYSENDDGVPTEFEIVRDVSNGVYVINSTAGSIDLDRQKILTIPSETVAFSERTGYWDSFYSYLPECMCRVGIDFLSFKNGKTFLHNNNKLRNNFYGVRFPSELWVVFNQAPSNNKVFNALGVESTTIWEAREILTDSGQKSQLIESDFQDDQGQGLIFDSKENIHYAALLQDENTPNVEYPLINGDDMRDVSILFKLTKDTDYLERIFAANINFALSQRSNK